MPPPPRSPGPHQASPGYDPYPPPPPAPREPAHGPSFTPHPPGGEDRQGPKHARGRGTRPRPTFTPREGYAPPAERERPAPAPTAFLPPVPAGYPQPSFQPFDFPETPRQVPRFVPADRAAPPAVQDNRTRILEPDAGQVPPTGPQRAAETTSPNLARSSKVMALGTLASRGTGFLRTLVLVIALGQATLSSPTTTPTRCRTPCTT